jgi:hypothetical protein
MKPTKPVPKYREIINGHVYDTETASVIFRFDFSDDPEAVWYLEPDTHYGLMQNVWGQYFCYYNDLDNSIAGGNVITPLDRAGAIKWMERHCSWLIESVFGKLHEAGEGPAYTPKEEV